MMMSVIAYAQINAFKDGYNTLYVGYAPYGFTTISSSPKSSDESIKYKYKSYWNVNICKEGKLRGFGTMVEVLFSKAKFNEIVNPEAASAVNLPTEADDLYVFDASFYGGQVFNKGRRVQFPLYGGAGIDYVKGSPFHHLTGHIGFKFRTNIYITEKFGIYCGANYKIGIGGSSKLGTLIPQNFYVDAGLVISFDK